VNFILNIWCVVKKTMQLTWPVFRLRKNDVWPFVYETWKEVASYQYLVW
jgi:hypothetical protein